MSLKWNARFAVVLALGLTFVSLGTGCDRTASEFFMERVHDAEESAKTACKMLEAGVGAADAEACRRGIAAGREFVEDTVPQSILQGKTDDGRESQGLTILSIEVVRGFIMPRCVAISVEQGANGASEHAVDNCMLGALEYIKNLVDSMCDIHWPKVTTDAPAFCPLTSDQVKSIRHYDILQKMLKESQKAPRINVHTQFKCTPPARMCP